MEQVIKRRIIYVAAILVVFACSAITSYAIDDRVSASKVTLNAKAITASEASSHSHWTKGYYKGSANGYVTAEARHYANVKLYLAGRAVKASGRKWGKGRVSVSTGWWTGGCALVPSAYGKGIFYGF